MYPQQAAHHPMYHPHPRNHVPPRDHFSSPPTDNKRDVQPLAETAETGDAILPHSMEYSPRVSIDNESMDFVRGHAPWLSHVSATKTNGKLKEN